MSEVVNGAGINNVNAHVKHNRSRFPLREVVADTHRFGEYHPIFVMEGIPGDRHPFRCIHDARSYTLKAPLMQNITMNKDFGMVNLRAILPFQSERITAHPNIGVDVPADCYTSVTELVKKVVSVIEAIFTEAANSYGADTKNFMTDYLKGLVLAESVFSYGSVLTSLGCSLSSCFTYEDVNQTFYTIDKVVDYVFGLIAADSASTPWIVTIDGKQYEVSNTPRNEGGAITWSSPRLNVHDFLQKIRDTSDWSFVSCGSFIETDDDVFDSPSIIYNDSGKPIDLKYLWAYHLFCAEFFTNDKVDYLYSADLFRQYIYSLISVSSPSSTTFSWNGFELQYDYLSSHYFNEVVAAFSALNPSIYVASLQYFLTLFGYHRSLRFKDYFTGSRTRPLAVATTNANTDVPVVGGQVSVIDVTRSIQAQRFLNAVNASGRKFGEYIDALFGVKPNKDMHEPIFLVHSSDTLFAAEVENTGAAQQSLENSVTAVFRGNSNNFEYSVSVDEPCVIIGVASYDIERLYPDAINRNFFIKDRFDMFIPEMQYIGDQPVYQHELFAGLPANFGVSFGYQFRDMQFKQLYPRCAGGFCTDSLPGYAFKFNKPTAASGIVISPDFIRAYNSELDAFYLKLTGFSLGTYFHFIVKQINVDDASREMIAQPQIL